MSAALNARLARLEAAAPSKPQRSITCYPFNPSWHGANCHQTVQEVAQGVLRIQSNYRPEQLQVAYTSRPELEAWLALPAQSDALQCIYVVVTPEQVRSTLERLDAEI